MRFGLTILLSILPLLGFLPTAAGAELFRHNGYEIRLDAKQIRDRLQVEGRIEGGPTCASLHLQVNLLNQNGGKKRLDLVVKEAGGMYSRLVEGGLRVKTLEQPWIIFEVTSHCSSR